MPRPPLPEPTTPRLFLVPDAMMAEVEDERRVEPGPAVPSAAEMVRRLLREALDARHAARRAAGGA